MGILYTMERDKQPYRFVKEKYQGILHTSYLQKFEHILLQIVCNSLVNYQCKVSMIAFVYQQNHEMHMELLQTINHAYDQDPLYQTFMDNQI